MVSRVRASSLACARGLGQGAGEGRGNHLIKCETRGGFHTSFGRGDPCTRYQSQNGEDAILLSGLGGRVLTSARLFAFPRRKRLLHTFRFPFPLGKGVGVRFFASSAMPAPHLRRRRVRSRRER